MKEPKLTNWWRDTITFQDDRYVTFRSFGTETGFLADPKTIRAIRKWCNRMLKEVKE